MAYEIPDPATLDAIDETLPAFNEDLALYDDALRQTRSIFKSVFLKEHNADGTHTLSADSLSPNSVTGDKIQSDGADDSKRAIDTNHIKNAAVTAAKLAPNAVATAGIADGSVTTVKYAADSIDDTKLKSNSVTTVKIADNAVTSGKVANSATTDSLRAITSDHIKDNALVARHYSEKSMPAKAVSLLVNQLLCGGAAQTGLACQVGGSLVLEVDETTVPPTARFQVKLGDDESSLIPYAFLSEVSPSGTTTGGGAAQADKWHDRPVDVGGARTFNVVDKNDILDVTGKVITMKQKGSYLVLGYAVAFKVNLHQTRIRDITNAKTLVIGSMEEADSGTNSQSSSIIMGFIQVPDDNIDLMLQHWTQSAYSSNSQAFGRASQNISSSNNLEVQTLAALLFIKVA